MLLRLGTEVAEEPGAGVTVDEKGLDESAVYSDEVAPAADDETGVDDETKEGTSKDDGDDGTAGAAVEDDVALGGAGELFDTGTEDDESGDCAVGATFNHI